MALQLCTGAHRAPRLSRRHRALLSCSPLPEEALCSSVAQQEVKVEVKDHLRAGDFERAFFYTQSRQDSEPGCQANNASVHRP